MYRTFQEVKNTTIIISTYITFLFVINNGNYFKVNSEIHNINTRNKSNLHLPIYTLSVYQKGTYTGNRVFNGLSAQTKDLPIIEVNLMVP